MPRPAETWQRAKSGFLSVLFLGVGFREMKRRTRPVFVVTHMRRSQNLGALQMVSLWLPSKPDPFFRVPTQKPTKNGMPHMGRVSSALEKANFLKPSGATCSAGQQGGFGHPVFLSLCSVWVKISECECGCVCVSPHCSA